MAKPRLFTIDPGAPFLATLTDTVLDGEIIPDLSRAKGPLALAAATIYVPTQRAAQALKRRFAEAHGGALLLPRILPLGALEDSETRALFDVPATLLDFGDDIPQAVGELDRRLQLTRLVLGWAKAVRHAIVSIDAGGRRKHFETEALLVGATPADAFQLAGGLASLIDEMIVEGIPWGRLQPLTDGLFDDYWRITLDFLSIAVRAWPQHLTEINRVDAATRQAKLIERDITRLEAGGPVIVAGSTGVHSATARLMAAVAGAPQGAIVLPGLDLALEDKAFAMIGAEGDGGASAGHPQAALSRLLKTLRVERGAFRRLGRPAPALALRGAFVSAAMRPADATDAWSGFAGTMPAPEVSEALKGVTLIEAAHEGEEALALALVLREALEHPSRSAMLVTPDRDLAQRVSAELLRWNIRISDSGGAALPMTPAGAFALLALDCAEAPLAAPALLALLTHPLTRLGFARGHVESLLAPLEIGALRGALGAADLHDPARLFTDARAAAADRRAHPARARITEAEWAGAQDLLARALAALTPLLNLNGDSPLSDIIAAHETALLALSRGADNATAISGRDGAALLDLLENARHASGGVASLGMGEYRALFRRLAGECVVPQEAGSHGRIAILGLLEARLLPADLVLLGGLDEGVWPPQADTGPFLNRPMRAALGLTPPERRIGQTAHDFCAAMGAQEVILSRAKKRGGEPTVASRLLQRLAALAGKDNWAACAAQGDRWLRYARAIDAAPPEKPLPRPNPKPPLRLRPTRLSVTQAETLRRDPYAVYANKILGLAALEPLGAGYTEREFGQWTHEALRLFGESHPLGPLPAEALEQLLAFAKTAFAALARQPEFTTLQWPALKASLTAFAAWDGERRGSRTRVHVELDGAINFTLADGSPFRLSARADRIEAGSDGAISIVDYKTGAMPAKTDVAAGFSPQLPLEAAIALLGGFAALPSAPQLAQLLFLKFGGAEAFAQRDALSSKLDASETARRQLADLKLLLDDFREEAQGYPSLPYAAHAPRHSDYRHLARVKEWSATGGEGDGEDEAGEGAA